MATVVMVMPFDMVIAPARRAPGGIIGRQVATIPLNARRAPIGRIVVGIIAARGIPVGIRIGVRMIQIHMVVARVIDPMAHGAYVSEAGWTVRPVPVGR